MIEIKDSVTGTTMQQFAGVVQSEVAHGITREALLAAASKESAKLESWVGGTAMESVQQHLGEKVVELLRNDAIGMFAAAWSKFSELKRSALESRSHPEGSSSVQLTEHIFTYGVSPQVEVHLNGVLIGKFAFSLKLHCTVSALELTIKNGAVIEIAAGRAEGSTAIELGDHGIWEKAFLHADLPGTLHLKHPVEIA